MVVYVIVYGRRRLKKHEILLYRLVPYVRGTWTNGLAEFWHLLCHMTEASRVVALIDMDCFYCACERALQPSLVGVPLAVVQYNPYQGDGSAGTSGVVSHPPEPASERIAIRDGKIRMPSAANGSIIAVSYEARARGVTRFFRAREVCPQQCCHS